MARLLKENIMTVENMMRHIYEARLSRDIARKQFAIEEARKKRLILTGMIVVGLGTAFLISVMIQVIKSI